MKRQGKNIKENIKNTMQKRRHQNLHGSAKPGLRSWVENWESFIEQWYNKYHLHPWIPQDYKSSFSLSPITFLFLFLGFQLLVTKKSKLQPLYIGFTNLKYVEDPGRRIREELIIQHPFPCAAAIPFQLSPNNYFQ